MMENSQSVKEKLVLVLLNLACRAIDEAKRVPYQIEQDNIVDILINEPALYQQMILEGDLDGRGIPQGKLLVKLNILGQIEEFVSLDRFDMSFGDSSELQINHGPIFAQINLLTKLFMAYHRNMVTTFEKEHNQFLSRYRKTIEDNGQIVEFVEIKPEELTAVKDMAEGHLGNGRYIEAFSLGKLFDPELIKKGPLRFAATGPSILEGIIRRAPVNKPGFIGLVKFALRACYLSHNEWNEVFDCLSALAEEEPNRYSRDLMVDLIDSDFVFACNLLHRPFDELRAWPVSQRREAILECLRRQPRPA
jgi:hypothetical protein